MKKQKIKLDKLHDFDSFCNEELIHAGRNGYIAELTDKDDNLLMSHLASDPHVLRQIVSDAMPNQNLRLLGYGSYGVAFDWEKRGPLPEDFFTNNLVGKDDTSQVEKIIKVTSFGIESNIITNLIRDSEGKKIDGIANFYWIKKIVLPDWLLKRKDIRNIVDKQESRKLKNIWLICLEKVVLLDEVERLILDLSAHVDIIYSNLSRRENAFAVHDYITSTDKKEEIYGFNGLDYLKQFNPKYSKILNIVEGYQKIIDSIRKLGIRQDDIHEYNLGWRGDELVAFDF
jgi:hypothetical protein